MSAETFASVHDSKSLKAPHVLETWNSTYHCQAMIVPVSGLLTDLRATAPVFAFLCMTTLAHAIRIMDYDVAQEDGKDDEASC